MGPISGYQGYYERSWAGTDFAMVLLRMPPKSKSMNMNRKTVIDARLQRIAAATRDADEINHLHNNLLYWAGLNLVASGTVTDQQLFVDAGLARTREGIRDIGLNGAQSTQIHTLAMK
jgi:poly(beta-D-mannuronate) lyase